MNASWTMITVLVLSVIFRSVENTFFARSRPTVKTIERAVFRSSLLTEGTHRAELFVSAGKKIVRFGCAKFAQLSVENKGKTSRHPNVIVMSPAFRFGNDLVDQLMFFQIFGGELESFGGIGRVLLIAPQDSRAAFGS